MVEISGFAAPGFAAVKDAFAANFEAGEELGARFSLVAEGDVVVDLWAGHADRARTERFGQNTLTPIFSSTKAITAVLMARLVEQGKLSYDQTVASVWPEFGQAGKAEITVEQALSHQAGLSGLVEPMDRALWLDWDAICARIAAQAPIWPPGTASGYHPATFGYIAGEIFRRIDGRTIGTALREDIAEPFGLDLWIGLPESEDARVADVQRPSALPNFGKPTAATKAAFLSPWSGTDPADPRWRRVEIPSANGHATALSLAKLAGALADGGWLEGDLVLSPLLISEMSRERIRGRDLVIPFDLSWGAGVMRNELIQIWGPGLETYGHAGWGGSCVFVDPQRKLGGAYVMNRQSAYLIGDPRSRRLIEAAYAG